MPDQILKYISYCFFRLFILLFRIMPFWLIYRISDLLYYIFYKVLNYRRAVIMANLTASFPDKKEKDLKIIMKEAYKNLADIMVEGIKGASMNAKQIKRRYKFLNPEILDAHYQAGQSVILVAGHYNNWEWAAFSPPYYFHHRIVALFKKLHNPYLNTYMKNARSSTGVHMHELRETAFTFKNYEASDQPSLYLLAADQSPSNTQSAYWIHFLNQDTPCLHGPEKYARMYNLPVVFAYPKRVKRGFYEVTVERLVEEVGQCGDGEITEAFMRRLEQIITHDPGNWLWSHKRWKHKRSPNEQELQS